MPGHKEQQHSTAAPKPLGPMLRRFPGGLPSKSLLGHCPGSGNGVLRSGIWTQHPAMQGKASGQALGQSREGLPPRSRPT